MNKLLPIIHIGPVAIQTPGLILILGLWSGLWIAEYLSPRFNINPNFLYNLVFIWLSAGIIGGRGFYVISNLAAFRIKPINLLSLNPGLLDPLGEITVDFIAASIYMNKSQFPFWRILDALTPLFGFVVISIGLSQFASGDAFGSETNLPWGILLWGVKRHPTQLYAALNASIILGIIWPRKRAPGVGKNKEGNTFLTYLALSSGSRIFLEAFRGDSVILWESIRMAQVTAWFLLALSLWGLYELK
jgi:phosphatidylglycerol:prolipoprotein diacylglycerol transferase